MSKVKKIIFEEYNRFMSEPILDINKPFRNMNGIIVETKEGDNSLQNIINDSHIDLVKKIGNLSGSPIFLGSGSEGSAYKFGSKVLKITKDRAEADAANIIAGKSHPNVYTIHIVRRLPDAAFKIRTGPFMIIYDYLDYPTREMADVTNHLDNSLKWSGGNDKKWMHKLFYFWDDSYTKSILSDFSSLIENSSDYDFDSVDKRLKPAQKYSLLLKKIRIGWTEERAMRLYSMLKLFGVWSGFDSIGAMKKMLLKMSDNKYAYICQLARGLTFLKSNGIEFDDLKTGNIMQRNGQVVIIDIGKSSVSSSKPIEGL